MAHIVVENEVSPDEGDSPVDASSDGSSSGFAATHSRQGFTESREESKGLDQAHGDSEHVLSAY